MMLVGRNLRLGVVVAGGLLLCATIALIAMLGYSYDGKCGGYIPGLSGPRPCSFVDFVSGSVVLYILLLGVHYWYLAIAIVVLPPLAGYLLDRRTRARL
jgi:hypothetical protein